jgi:predicted DCC family thiol-disulfide oxidoreductase YuxK
MFKNPDAILIYDGECRFCLACLAWVKRKLEITAISFQEANLDQYGLVRSECEKSVFVVTKEVNLSGATAVAYLLKLRGNSILAWIIQSSGWIGESGYRWVASHRDSLVIRVVTKYVEGVVSRKG